MDCNNTIHKDNIVLSQVRGTSRELGDKTMPPKKATNSTKNLNNQPRIDSFGEKGAGASKHRDTTGTPSLDSGVRTRATVPRVVRLKAPSDAAEPPPLYERSNKERRLGAKYNVYVTLLVITVGIGLCVTFARAGRTLLVMVYPLRKRRVRAFLVIFARQLWPPVLLHLGFQI